MACGAGPSLQLVGAGGGLSSKMVGGGGRYSPFMGWGAPCGCWCWASLAVGRGRWWVLFAVGMGSWWAMFAVGRGLWWAVFLVRRGSVGADSGHCRRSWALVRGVVLGRVHRWWGGAGSGPLGWCGPLSSFVGWCWAWVLVADAGGGDGPSSWWVVVVSPRSRSCRHLAVAWHRRRRHPSVIVLLCCVEIGRRTCHVADVAPGSGVSKQ